MQRRSFLKILPGTLAALSLGYETDGSGSIGRRTSDDLPRWTRVVSLSVMQERLMRECSSGLCGNPEVQSLAGLTRIDGYILDVQNRDVLLLGAAEKTA